MPIVGIGVDVVGIARFAAALSRSPRFVERVFTPREIEQCGSGEARIASLAARWAAKEAVAKALVDASGLQWHHCEVVRSGTGQPVLELTGTVLEASRARGVASWLLSLSHDGDMAIAFVIAQRGAG